MRPRSTGRIPLGGADERPVCGPAAAAIQHCQRSRSGLPRSPPRTSIHDELAALERPRKHYQWYYSTREANDNMRNCPQGIHAFLRAYYHYKSADWKQNKPFPLKSWSAAELAKLPTYYIMDLDKGMAETVAPMMPSAAEIAACKWLPDDELRVYSSEFNRTGFQGGLQWYRCMTSGKYTAELQTFSGRTIDVPSCFIAGKSDWGIYQKPGDFEKNAEERMHQDAGLSPGGRSRALGAAGAARENEPVAPGVPATLGPTRLRRKGAVP